MDYSARAARSSMSSIGRARMGWRGGCGVSGRQWIPIEGSREGARGGAERLTSSSMEASSASAGLSVFSAATPRLRVTRPAAGVERRGGGRRCVHAHDNEHSRFMNPERSMSHRKRYIGRRASPPPTGNNAATLSYEIQVIDTRARGGARAPVWYHGTRVVPGVPVQLRTDSPAGRPVRSFTGTRLRRSDS
jgi:hypothetical protein